VCSSSLLRVLDVYYVPCRSCLNTCVRVCHSCTGPLRESFEPGASGLPHTVAPSVCVSSVIGVLGVWIQQQKSNHHQFATKPLLSLLSQPKPKKKKSLREYRFIRSGASGLPYYCAPLVCVSDVMELTTVWWYNKPKTKKKNRIVRVVFIRTST